MKIHTALAGGVHSTTGNNFFACSFVFNIATARAQELLAIPIVVFVAPYHVIEKGAKKDIMVFKSGEYVAWEGDGKTQDYMAELNRLQVGFYNYLEQDRENPQNAAINLLISSYFSIIERFRLARREERRMALSSSIRIDDSEMIAISSLQNPEAVNRIIESFHEILAARKITRYQITSIEFHGCTTRDMCPFCFVHMNMVQWLANLSNDNSFLGRLKNKLRKEGRESGIAVTTFISSTIETKKNLNFIPSSSSSSSTQLVSGMLYQFRLNPSLISLSTSPFYYSGSASSRSLSSASSSSLSFTSSSSSSPASPLPKPPSTPSSSSSTSSSSSSSSSSTTITTSSPSSSSPSYPPQAHQTVIFGEIHFQQIDVSNDGNCGVWALMQASEPQKSYMLPDKAQRKKMKKLRKKAAKRVIIGEAGAGQATRDRIITGASDALDFNHWIATDDFRYFAQSLQRSIIVIRPDMGQFEHYLTSGASSGPRPLSMLNMAANSGKNLIFLSYMDNHYQALVPMPANGHSASPSSSSSSSSSSSFSSLSSSSSSSLPTSAGPLPPIPTSSSPVPHSPQPPSVSSSSSSTSSRSSTTSATSNHLSISLHDPIFMPAQSVPSSSSSSSSPSAAPSSTPHPRQASALSVPSTSGTPPSAPKPNPPSDALLSTPLLKPKK
jgi:hypothetical protein